MSLFDIFLYLRFIFRKVLTHMINYFNVLHLKWWWMNSKLTGHDFSVKHRVMLIQRNNNIMFVIKLVRWILLINLNLLPSRRSWVVSSHFISVSFVTKAVTHPVTTITAIISTPIPAHLFLCYVFRIRLQTIINQK